MLVGVLMSAFVLVLLGLASFRLRSENRRHLEPVKQARAIQSRQQAYARALIKEAIVIEGIPVALKESLLQISDKASDSALTENFSKFTQQIVSLSQKRNSKLGDLATKIDTANNRLILARSAVEKTTLDYESWCKRFPQRLFCVSLVSLDALQQ